MQFNTEEASWFAMGPCRRKKAVACWDASKANESLEPGANRMEGKSEAQQPRSGGGGTSFSRLLRFERTLLRVSCQGVRTAQVSGNTSGWVIEGRQLKQECNSILKKLPDLRWNRAEERKPLPAGTQARRTSRWRRGQIGWSEKAKRSNQEAAGGGPASRGCCASRGRSCACRARRRMWRKCSQSRFLG